MARWPHVVLLLLAAGCAAAQRSEASDMTQAIFSKLGSSPSSPKLTLWTPGHLDDLHDALLQGRPLRAQLSALPEGSADLQRERARAPGTHKLSLWVPRGQQHQAVAAANEWREDGWSDRSAVMVREAAGDDDDDLGAGDEQDGDGVAMSPSWLRGALAARGLADGPENGLAAQGQPRVPRQPAAPAAPAAADSGSLGHFRPKRAASPGPNEASAEDASVAADSSKRTPPGPPPQQAKAARSHQFVTGRNEKEPPPVVREVEHPAERPGGGGQGPADGKSDARAAPGHGQGAAPAPTHPSPVAAGSSRVGAGRDVLGRDALGLRVNEIPQGPSASPRFSHVYESETQRHAADHRHYTADAYGSHNAYAATYGGSYGSSASAASAYPSAAYPPLPGGGGAAYPPPQHGRNAPTATPRRIIYYASLPDPAPAPHLQQQMLQQQQHLPGASRVPHEYRGPPYDINGAYSSDARYPPPPLPAQGPGADNLYRYTIIDAEPPGPLLGGYRSNALPYRDRLPAASPAPAAFPQPYRLSPPLPPPPPSATTDAGPQAASPIQYTQYDYNGIGARTASSSALLDSKQGVVQGLPPGVPLSDDPYRGFNPRQPAPWSMQVGTRLTVKDDGYGSSSGGGPGGLPPAARRFYVTSQQQPNYGEAAYAPAYAPAHAQARFPRPLDRGDRSGSGQRSEARNRLFR